MNLVGSFDDIFTVVALVAIMLAAASGGEKILRVCLLVDGIGGFFLVGKELPGKFGSPK